MARLRDQFVNRYRGGNQIQQALFPPARPFSEVKEAISESESFQWIRRMPKGSLLHTHSTLVGRAEFVAKLVSDLEGCQIYWPPSNVRPTEPFGKIIFAKRPPVGYRSAQRLASEIEDFESRMVRLLSVSLEGEPPWQQLIHILARMNGFITHQPAFQAYFEDAFETLVADGIDSVEMRTGMGTLTDLDGNQWKDEAFIDQYCGALQRVRTRHPNFAMKLILNDGRGNPVSSVDQHYRLANRMRDAFPTIVIGFDLVGEETKYNPNTDYLPMLTEARQWSRTAMPLYLHSGETLWVENQNVVDAILLQARRIGHGINLAAYPEAERRMRENGIALEVCPISNQMLGLVNDLRLHPAGGFHRRGIPCVLGSDDPLVFGNEGLSFDFWIAWMAWGLTLGDLRMLAENSIRYSGMSEEAKEQAVSIWEEKWDVFEEELLSA